MNTGLCNFENTKFLLSSTFLIFFFYPLLMLSTSHLRLYVYQIVIVTLKHSLTGHIGLVSPKPRKPSHSPVPYIALLFISFSIINYINRRKASRWVDPWIQYYSTSLWNISKKIVLDSFPFKPTRWLWYQHDPLVVWSYGISKPQSFLTHLNFKKKPIIKFIFEIETEWMNKF